MEISADLTKKVESAIIWNRLVGNTSFTDDEFESLLETARNIVMAYDRRELQSINGQSRRLIFVVLVELAKRWRKVDEDENDDKGFWEFVFLELEIPWKHRLYNLVTVDVIDKLGYQQVILVANTKKKYWATLMMHAFAPARSIFAFLDLCYNVYKQDFRFIYTDDHKGYCDLVAVRFCEILRDSVGTDKTISIGSNTYSVRIGLRSLALNIETEKDFVSLLDKTFEAINKLFHRQTFIAGNYHEALVIDWWGKKQVDVSIDRKLDRKGVPAVLKTNITVRFIRNSEEVCLVVPSIILNDKTSVVSVRVYTGDNYEQRVDEELGTIIGELVTRTTQREFELNQLLQDSQSIKIKVEIIENGAVIYHKAFEKDFLLFDGEKEVSGQIFKAGNYFVYSREINALDKPAEIGAAGAYLYSIYPKSGESLKGNFQQVFFGDKDASSKSTASLFGGSTDCEWRCGGSNYTIYKGRVRLFVPSDIEISGLELRVGNENILLATSPCSTEERSLVFDITEYLPQRKPVQIVIYSHMKEKQLLQNDVIVWPKLDIVLNKSFYYGDDKKTLVISEESTTKELSWDNTQDKVVYPLNSGELIIRIPYLCWRVDNTKWRNEPHIRKLWYKKHFHSGSIVEIDSPLDMGKAEMFAKIGNRTEKVERNRTSGNYEVGKLIFAHEHNREITFSATIANSTVELFVVATEEHFIESPLLYSGGKLLWQPEWSFVGDDKREFVAEFRIKEQLLVRDGLRVADTIIEGLADGVYDVIVSSHGNSLFREERRVLYSDEIVVGCREKFRFANKCIKIMKISEKLISSEGAEMCWRQLSRKYCIDKIEFRGNDGMERYLGHLFTENDSGKKFYINTMMNEQGSYDEINPVQIEMVASDIFELVAGCSSGEANDGLGSLIYDKTQQEICNINSNNTERYCCINYYKFWEK